MLTPEEQQTLASYKTIASTRNDSHGNPHFWRAEFTQFNKLLPSGKIIDIGCGAGRDALLFCEHKYDYTGVDLSPEMLQEAKRLVPHADFLEMSMYNLNFLPHTFDGFWAAASLLHIPKHKVTTVLEQIKTIAKPGAVGFFAMKEGNGEKLIQGTKEEDKRFFAFYQEDEFLQILEKQGFTVLEYTRDAREYNPNKNLTVWLRYFVQVH